LAGVQISDITVVKSLLRKQVYDLVSIREQRWAILRTKYFKANTSMRTPKQKKLSRIKGEKKTS
jgi:hypothetical protein